MSQRTTLVTGASSGIGRELALRAAADSATVVLVARRRERRELVDQLDQLERRGIVVDHLVNNAGLGLDGPFHSNERGRELATVAVNVVALHELLGAFLPGMAERGMMAGARVVVPGVANKINAFAATRAPKRLVIALAGRLFEPSGGDR